MMIDMPATEDEKSRMLFSKLRQVVAQKFGYGIRVKKVTNVLLYKMDIGDLRRILRHGALYHIKRIYREIFTFGQTVIVTVEQGQLKGRKIKSVLGKIYFRFQGIPYAKPPLGPLRFKDPEPPEPWSGVRSALREGDICIQADVITGLTKGSENCLYLNVFTPQLPEKGTDFEGKPVMVWIHGGGFHIGSGNAEVYGPDFFLNDDVILVTLNYRLGAIGFLSVGTEDAPGNAGLKDILQALKWIQKNISVFGGDSKRVTIFGESAGGAAVHFLMLSPHAKGLFSRAISQSGSALCPWAMVDNPLETAFKLGRAFGLETKDPKVLVDYLRKISPKVLAKKQNVAISERNARENLPFAFLPCVEPPSPNAFITDHPLNIMKNKGVMEVPYITGINENEGSMALKPIVDKIFPAEVINADFERLVPRFLNLSYGSSESKEFAKKIRTFYFKGKPFDKNTYREYTELTTDTYFLYPANVTSILLSKFRQSPVYNYHFLFDGGFALFKKILNIKNIPGPVHADDIGYLFHVPILGQNINLRSKEMKVVQKMVRLWTNFAKYGNPTPDLSDPHLKDLQWKPFTEETPYYLEIEENFSVKANIKEERINFWKKLQEEV